MFERSGCSWCAAWREEIGPIYPKTKEGRTAPLREADIIDQPTSVEDGKEVGRITGYPGSAFFWGLLADILAKLGSK